MVKLEPKVIRRLSCDSRCLFPVDIGLIKSRDPPYIGPYHILTAETRPTEAFFKPKRFYAPPWPALIVVFRFLEMFFSDQYLSGYWQTNAWHKYHIYLTYNYVWSYKYCVLRAVHSGRVTMRGKRDFKRMNLTRPCPDIISILEALFSHSNQNWFALHCIFCSILWRILVVSTVVLKQ